MFFYMVLYTICSINQNYGKGASSWNSYHILRKKPKISLLNLQKAESLLQSTFLRMKKCMPESNIISMTGVKHAANVRFQLSSFVENPVVLSEPISKNTAPAIVLATKYISC